MTAASRCDGVVETPPLPGDRRAQHPPGPAPHQGQRLGRPARVHRPRPRRPEPARPPPPLREGAGRAAQRERHGHPVRGVRDSRPRRTTDLPRAAAAGDPPGEAPASRTPLAGVASRPRRDAVAVATSMWPGLKATDAPTSKEGPGTFTEPVSAYFADVLRPMFSVRRTPINGNRRSAIPRLCYRVPAPGGVEPTRCRPRSPGPAARVKPGVRLIRVEGFGRVRDNNSGTPPVRGEESN
jgi:hypothetical protein